MNKQPETDPGSVLESVMCCWASIREWEVFQTDPSRMSLYECVTDILGFDGLGRLCYFIQAFPDDGQNLSVHLCKRLQRLTHSLYPLLLHHLDILLTTHTYRVSVCISESRAERSGITPCKIAFWVVFMLLPHLHNSQYEFRNNAPAACK